jgi:AcrR family transcriptional regulator
MAREPADHRRATAERNIEAICDAVQRLLERGSQISFTAVASESRLSRVTVYEHFKNRQRLLEAALAHAVRGAAEALQAAEPERGDPFRALDRVINVAWRHLERAGAMVKATAEQLPAARRQQLHGPAFAPVHRLVVRGQGEGVFRSDVPAGWLVACSYALIHAAADEVREGRLATAVAPKVLTGSLHDLFRGGRTASPSKSRPERHRTR